MQHQVLNVSGQNVGYLLFNDHVLTAEEPLIDAFTDFQGAGVTDLVLDLRYNGGGYLYIASQVAYMIAGSTRTNGQVFERTQFNSKRTAENSDTEFIDIACVPDPNTFLCTQSGNLPTLNLARVYVLVSGSTCSASEAIVNGLRGVDVDVRLIGDTTCGKPYGFFGQDNCGVTYFPIEFQGVNAKGFGDYADGFVPADNNNGSNVLGCDANDDLDHALGDPAEGQLAQALFHRSSGSACLAVSQNSSRQSTLSLRASKAPASVKKPVAADQPQRAQAAALKARGRARASTAAPHAGLLEPASNTLVLETPMQKVFQVVRKAAVPVVLLSLLAACGGGGGGSNEVAQSCSPNNPYRVDATGPVDRCQPHGREAVGARLRQ